ncbi:MAG: transcriptional regulator with PAS, ATPase and Fis domain [Colwellia sp.]|jgi:transcriptional regulator with PAS, ATPase and Fis domain
MITKSNPHRIFISLLVAICLGALVYFALLGASVPKDISGYSLGLFIIIISIVFLSKDRVKQKKLIKLEQQEELLHKFKLIVEYTANSVVIINEMGLIEYVNKSLSKMSGYKPEQVLGKSPQICSSGSALFNTYEKLYKLNLRDLIGEVSYITNVKMVNFIV